MKSDGIRDQSHSDFDQNQVETWGDHEGLKIFLLNRLFSLQFNQELRKTRWDTLVFKGDLARKSKTV